MVALADVEPGPRAVELAAEHGKDPRLVEVVLSETAELVRADRGRLICRTRHGFVCANAGVDASNAGAADTLVLLPLDPDASARRLRAELGCAVVIADSFGRAWRQGQCEVAIGCAGLTPARDWRGEPDSDGRELARLRDRDRRRGRRRRGPRPRQGRRASPPCGSGASTASCCPTTAREPPRSSGRGPTTSSARARRRRTSTAAGWGGEGAARTADSNSSGGTREPQADQSDRSMPARPETHPPRCPPFKRRARRQPAN